MTRSGDKIELWWSPLGDLRTPVGTVTSTAVASTLARHLSSNPKLRFRPHVWLDDPQTVWWADAAPRPQDYKEILTDRARARGKAAVEKQMSRWAALDQDIATALAQLEWEDILRVPGAPTSHCLLMHRLKGARLTSWSAVCETVACPHCPDDGHAGGSLTHVFWYCPMAQRLWRALRIRWDHLFDPRVTLERSRLPAHGLTASTDRHARSPLGSGGIKRFPKPSPHATSATHQALQAVWKLQVMATFHAIWRWRHENPLWTSVHASVYHDACLRATLLQPRGLGGSGAVIVKTDASATHASIVWSAAMSAASSKTTNYQAEYDGVIAGLRAAKENGWTPLEVVGDSMLILRQLREYRPPINATLLTKYAEARRLGDALGVRQWRHHLRALNKMADAAANAAMDVSASSQVKLPTTRPEHAALEQHLASDFAIDRQNTLPE